VTAEPRLMGVVNVTPDSFSDGGRFFAHEDAIAQGRKLVVDGAALVDVGGESTRPGSDPVAEDEERRRVLPVIEALAGEGVEVSVDTTKAAVAGPALEAGAAVVNDVSALRFDPELADVTASAGATCVLMHMLGEPRTMQDDPRYGDVVDDVKAFLEERLAFAVGAGIAEEKVWLDPGIGFGKTAEHNLELLRRLGEIAAIGRPVVIGTSRKSFLGKITGRSEEGRLAGTVASNVLALERGAEVFRVHDVAEVGDALRVAAAVLR
jgi:dihydropteroate synthase